MSDTGHPLVARLYDSVMAAPERYLLGSHREYLADGLAGDVLEIGTGTGAMLPYFESVEDIDSLTAIEPDPHMRRQAVERADGRTIDPDIVDADAADLPFGDDAFDAVVVSLAFCTIPDEEGALDEVTRVLRPGGEFRFLEHVRGRGTVGTIHGALAPCWYHAAGGCHLDRETGERFRRDDRFDLLDFRRFESGTARLLPLVRGRLELRRSGSGGGLL